MEIVSSQNEKIKLVASLKEKKYREQYKLFVCEGKKPVDEALACGYEMQMLFYIDEKEAQCYAIKEKYKVSTRIMQKMTAFTTANTLLATFKQKQQKVKDFGNFLVLENVQDAGNFGAIIRSSFACNFNKIYAINCVDMFDAKALRSSMGAMFKVEVVKISLEDFIVLKLDNLVCASMEGENIYSSKIDFPSPCGVVLGNEGHGVSDALRALCKKTISIPMQKGQESLNVAVSASLIMYAIRYNLKSN